MFSMASENFFGKSFPSRTINMHGESIIAAARRVVIKIRRCSTLEKKVGKEEVKVTKLKERYYRGLE